MAKVDTEEPDGNGEIQPDQLSQNDTDQSKLSKQQRKRRNKKKKKQAGGNEGELVGGEANGSDVGSLEINRTDTSSTNGDDSAADGDKLSRSRARKLRRRRAKQRNGHGDQVEESESAESSGDPAAPEENGAHDAKPQQTVQPAIAEEPDEPVVEDAKPEPVPPEASVQPAIAEEPDEPIVEDVMPEPVPPEASVQPAIAKEPEEPIVADAKPEPVTPEASVQPVIAEEPDEPIVEDVKPEPVQPEVSQEIVKDDKLTEKPDEPKVEEIDHSVQSSPVLPVSEENEPSVEPEFVQPITTEEIAEDVQPNKESDEPIVQADDPPATNPAEEPKVAVHESQKIAEPAEAPIKEDNPEANPPVPEPEPGVETRALEEIESPPPIAIEDPVPVTAVKITVESTNATEVEPSPMLVKEEKAMSPLVVETPSLGSPEVKDAAKAQESALTTTVPPISTEPAATVSPREATAYHVDNEKTPEGADCGCAACAIM